MSRGSQTIGILSRTRRSTAAFRSSRLRRPECFQAKWIPVRVEKTRQNMNPEPGSDSTGTEEARANERPRVTVEWATLIGRVADGDREAFRRLFEHFAPRVKGLMLKTGASRMSAATAAPTARGIPPSLKRRTSRMAFASTSNSKTLQYHFFL